MLAFLEELASARRTAADSEAMMPPSVTLIWGLRTLEQLHNLGFDSSRDAVNWHSGVLQDRKGKVSSWKAISRRGTDLMSVSGRSCALLGPMVCSRASSK